MATYRDAAALGAEIERLRRQAGLDQRAVARHLEVHESAISRLESGQRGLSVEELFRLAELFGVDADSIALEAEAEPALLRTAAAGDAEVARCLDAFDAAIEDYFSARALERFL
jgi:transcriptional regulator with XRE-family HTH domain